MYQYQWTFEQKWKIKVQDIYYPYRVNKHNETSIIYLIMQKIQGE